MRREQSQADPQVPQSLVPMLTEPLIQRLGCLLSGAAQLCAGGWYTRVAVSIMDVWDGYRDSTVAVARALI